MTSLRDDLAQHTVMALWEQGWHCVLSVASPPRCIADEAIWPFWNPQTDHIVTFRWRSEDVALHPDALTRHALLVSPGALRGLV